MIIRIMFHPLFSGSSPAQHSHQYWAPVVANHFPPTSPFIQAPNVGYSLLPQGTQFSPPPRVPTVTHPPLTKQRSGGASGDYSLLPQTPKLERKRSKKGTREVSALQTLRRFQTFDPSKSSIVSFYNSEKFCLPNRNHSQKEKKLPQKNTAMPLTVVQIFFFLFFSST